MKRIILLSAFLAVAFSAVAGAVTREEVIRYFTGCEIYSAEPEPVFLGVIDGKYKQDSIFYEYGKYGNKHNRISIWNIHGKYGGEYAAYSARNKNTTMPPYIVKDGYIVARLTTNENVKNGVSPDDLKIIFDE